MNIRLSIFIVSLFMGCSFHLHAQNWEWITTAGPSGTNTGSAISSDSIGNLYVIGQFEDSISFDTVTCIGPSAQSAGPDIFISKFSPEGYFLWSQCAGSPFSEYSGGICTDRAGNTYITGEFNFSIDLGPFHLTAPFGAAYIAKLDTDGEWQWAKVIKPADVNGAVGYDLVADADGNVLISGSIFGNVAFDSISLASKGRADIFVAKIDPNGQWLWAKSAGGSRDDFGYGIGVDPAGNCYVTGVVKGNAYFGADTLNTNNRSAIFVAKLSTNGDWLWTNSTQTIFNYDLKGESIVADSMGNAYLTGFIQGRQYFGQDTLWAFPSYPKVFLAKVNHSGAWEWAKMAQTPSSGVGIGTGNGIAIDHRQHLYIGGWFRDVLAFDNISLSTSSNEDIFIVEFDPSGNALAAIQGGGGSFLFRDVDITIGLDRSVGITGMYAGTAHFGNYSFTSGLYNVFVAQSSLGTTGITSTIEWGNAIAYPNPFTQSAIIEFEYKAGKSYQVLLFNSMGNLIKTIEHMASPGEIKLERNNLPSGLYFYRLQCEGKEIATGKLIAE